MFQGNYKKIAFKPCAKIKQETYKMKLLYIENCIEKNDKENNRNCRYICNVKHKYMDSIKWGIMRLYR